MSPLSPIAVIDSGLGGLCVVRALRSALPKEDIVYFGDTARGPYSFKSLLLIQQFAKELVAQVRTCNPKQVVIACHAMAGAGLGGIRGMLAEFAPSIGLEAVARAAVEMAGPREMPIIGVITNEAAIRSKAYDRAIHRRRHHARLLMRPTPLLDAALEEGRDDNDALLKLMLKQYVHPVLLRGANVLVLGSSHYSVIKEMIVELCGDDVAVVDASQSTAQDVLRRLAAAGLLRGGNGTGTLRCILTDETPRFATLGKRFLGEDPGRPQIVSLAQLAGAADRGMSEIKVA